ncbi:MAG: UDP binding domain-containing protein [Xanthobacteraceae bacterium]
MRSLLPGGTVGILRLSYKPYTAVIDASQGVAIAAALAEAGYSVIVSDPQAAPAAQTVLGSLVEVAAAEPCAARCGIRIITTPWPQYKDLPLAALQRAGGRLIVVDCWRLLLPAAVGEAVDLVYLGQGADQQAAMDETSGRADIVTQVRRRARRRPRPVRPNQACLTASVQVIALS